MSKKDRTKFYAPKGTKYGDIWNKQRGRCHYCGTKMVPLPPIKTDRQPTLPRHATIDHVNPLSNGGPRKAKSNLVYACLSCNQRKANSTTWANTQLRIL